MIDKKIKDINKYNIQPKNLKGVEILVTPSPEMGFWRNNEFEKLIKILKKLNYQK